MEVQVKLEIADLVAVNTLFRRGRSSRWLFRLVLFGTFAVILGLLMAESQTSKLPIGLTAAHFLYPALFLLGGGALWGIGYVAQRWQMTKTVKQFASSPWTIAISPDGVTVHHTALSRTFNQWLHYQEVVQTEDHIFLVLGANLATPIPRHCFADKQAFVEFGEHCCNYFDDAQNLTPATLPSTVHLPKLKRSTGITDEPPTV